MTVLAGALFVLTVVHDLDHVRQGRTLGTELYVVAALALAWLAGVFFLARRRHALTSWAALLMGLSTVVGVAGVHVAPHRSWFSDPYPATHADLLSWSIIAGMMALGALLAAAGWTLGFGDRKGQPWNPRPVSAGRTPAR